MTPYSFRALSPLCSCRFFGCRRCCLWPPAFSCFPELCCPWLQEAPRPSPRPPRPPAMFPARSLQPLSPAPTRRSPRRSPGGDLSVERGRRIMTGESWGWERRVHSSASCPRNPGSGLPVQNSGSWGLLNGAFSSPSGLWWRSAWQPALTSSLRLHPCES